MATSFLLYRKWPERWDLNPREPVPETAAIATELSRRIEQPKNVRNFLGYTCFFTGLHELRRLYFIPVVFWDKSQYFVYVVFVYRLIQDRVQYRLPPYHGFRQIGVVHVDDHVDRRICLLYVLYHQRKTAAQPFVGRKPLPVSFKPRDRVFVVIVRTP